MKFYKYWARVEEQFDGPKGSWPLIRYAGSNVSQDDAARHAAAKAKEIADTLRMGQEPDFYLYNDRPVREEIVDEIIDGGETVGVITRNAYGSLVLNTERVMFVDIDDDPAARKRMEARKRANEGGGGDGGGWLKRLFGGKKGAVEEKGAWVSDGPEVEANPIEARVMAYVEKTPGLGMRLYRTAAGYRCLITSGLYDPASDEAEQIMRSLESDPMYMKLCAVQECFRARLTAKFWRCGAVRPPVRFPYANEAQEFKLREWAEGYHNLADRCAVCELVGVIGPQGGSPAIEKIVSVHDEMCIRPGAGLA